jgi:hypothetical protein
VPLHRWLEDRNLPLRELSDEEQYAEVTPWWRQLPARELFVLNKLMWQESSPSRAPTGPAGHKSGSALRFSRIARWRIDKPANQADRPADLDALLPEVTQSRHVELW